MKSEKVIEQISVFDIFKIGIGPSSSHTLGPWRAAELFLKVLKSNAIFNQITGLKILLYGSLAKTGKGHATDVAILLGLSGEDPVTIDVDQIAEKVMDITTKRSLLLSGEHQINFSVDEDILYLYNESLGYHPNALTFQAFFKNGSALSETYYSVGGGFVIQGNQVSFATSESSLHYPINNAHELLTYCQQTGLPISGVVFANELFWRSPVKITKDFHEIIKVIKESIYRGCHTTGVLPGGLHVKRRAADINIQLLNGVPYKTPAQWYNAIKNSERSFSNILDWVSCFALAVNEENASMGRIVTAPTNGAAGVIPAVLMYYVLFCSKNKQQNLIKFMFTAAEVGSIFKKGATISAAMGGCQAEIGVSSAMAAAGLAECLGGSPEQALMAAEIAMEHHLGLTCDPIGGLVQIPCIERNTMGAIKAITAAHLALKSDSSQAKVSLDAVVDTMWATARDMNSKYKETSDGGLAIQIPLNLPEC